MARLESLGWRIQKQTCSGETKTNGEKSATERAFMFEVSSFHCRRPYRRQTMLLSRTSNKAVKAQALIVHSKRLPN